MTLLTGFVILRNLRRLVAAGVLLAGVAQR